MSDKTWEFVTKNIGPLVGIIVGICLVYATIMTRLEVMDVKLTFLQEEVETINDKLNFLTGLKDNPFDK